MKYLILLIALLCLAGCTTPKYGNFISHAPYDINFVLVNNAVKKLESLYPPASTKLNISQPITKYDTFGDNLITNLRSKGYAVREYQEKQQPLEGLRFGYIIDAPTNNNLYRLKLVVGRDILTRAFAVDNKNTIVPAGSWARMEDQ